LGLLIEDALLQKLGELGIGEVVGLGVRLWWHVGMWWHVGNA
jgi:hypothetical protein